jgi:hypothetical protein
MKRKNDDFEKFENLSLKLGIPVLSATIAVDSYLNDQLIDRYSDRCHTWNRNMWNWSFAIAARLPIGTVNFGAGYLSLRRTDASLGGLDANQLTANPIGEIDDSRYGILTGRGDTAESFEGYTLATPITHGTGANQLSHRAQNATLQEYTSATKTWKATLTRLFDNLSGATITITESGIIYGTAAYAYLIMMCRDLLASSVDVMNNGVLSVTYNFTLTFPE